MSIKIATIAQDAASGRQVIPSPHRSDLLQGTLCAAFVRPDDVPDDFSVLLCQIDARDPGRPPH